MEFWKDRRVLVTGADGFIGSWLARALVHRGAQVTTLVRDLKSRSNIDLLGLEKTLNIVPGDVVDYELLLRTLHEYEIDTCFHLAAQALVGIAVASPLSTFESNIKGTWTVLEASRQCGVERVVVASSDKAYGEQNVLPYREDQPLLGRYPYDASKACADILAQAYYATYGMSLAVTRNANTYGPGDSNFSRLIPGTIKAVWNDETPVIRSDGTPERDYMYIDDAVEAYLVVGESLGRPEVKGQAFNFGTGRPVKVLDLFNMIIELCGKSVSPRILGEEQHAINRQYLCAEKAQRLLGWKPKHTLEDGLRETIHWYQQHLFQ